MVMGPRDLQEGTIELVRRDTKEKITLQREGVVPQVIQLLDAIQTNIYQRALTYQQQHTFVLLIIPILRSS